ncbi:MAG TPA: hypothetical protein VFH80_29910 [Solirubrobacteraceae bacterium]|nr:hypothetical protein [Solirubrobacteraceae bacterium]
MAAGTTVQQLALVPLSFPTYSNALSRSAVTAARELTLAGSPESDDDIDPDATTIDPMALSPG